MPESIPASLIIDTLRDTFREARATLAAEVAEPPMHTHLGWILSVPDTHQKTVLAALDKEDSIRVVTCATEDEATAIAAGLHVGGEPVVLMIQHAGLYASINFKNGVYHTSGAQGIPGGLSVDFVMMARAAGYRMATVVDDLGDLTRRLPEILTAQGPVFVELHTGLAEQTPMTVRERTPFYQQLHDARAKLLRPRASASADA
jgi:sulfopyruvate decarboxylase TPP-binding subunit